MSRWGLVGWVITLWIVSADTVRAEDRKLCLQQLYDGKPPLILNEKLSEKTYSLCYSQMMVLYSGLARGPLWSAERLTAERITQARELIRPPSTVFHPEMDVPAEERSELSDYKKSGFDRGHMAPNGDMSTPEAQIESFSLANMIPQHPCNNEVLWEGVEEAVRKIALAEGEVYVVTGPAYIGDTLQSLKGRVLIPSHVYKAVYIPKKTLTGVYFSINDGSQSWQPISIEHLSTLIGIDVFPSLDASVKSVVMELPEPIPRRGCRLRTSEVANQGNPIP